MSLTGGRRLPSQQLVGLEGSGRGRLGSGGTAVWLSDPLRPSTSSIRASALPAGVLPTLHKGSRLKPGASKPSSEGGSRTSPTVSGFLHPPLPRQEGFGVLAPHHRPVDPERVHHLVTLPHETPRSVLNSIRPGDWMISLDLQDAYLQVPVHHDSHRYLRFVVDGKTFQFRVLCFGLTTAPLSLHEDYGTSVRHPPQARGQDASLPGRLAHPGLFKDRLSSVEGQAPISLYRTWHPGQPHEVVSGSLSVPSVLRHGDPFSAFYCSSHTSTSQQSRSTDRGVPFNPVSSSVPLASPSRPPVFPDPTRLRRNDQDEAPPTLPQGPVGLPGRPVPSLLVPSLSRGSSLVVERGSAERVSLSLPAPDISFFSDASDVGWGALVGEHHASGLWLPHQKALSINMRELLAVQLGLQAFEYLILGMSVALFCDNTTTVAYLRRSGGTFSSTLNSTTREVLLWAESRRIRLLPQFIMGSSNVNADALSHPNQVIGSEWTLHQEVVDQLVHKWPAMIDLFATSLTARLPVYFSPASDPRAAGTDALLQPWDDLQAYAFPPIAIIRRVLLKLRSSKYCELTLIAPFWPQRDWFPDLLELLSDVPITLSGRRDLLRQPHFHRFHQNLPMLRLTA